MNLRPSKIIVLSACCLLLSAVASAQNSRSDLSSRDPEIHWPKPAEPSIAPVFSHNELVLRVNCQQVWNTFTKVTAWPTWFVLVKDVSIDGPDKAIKQGSLLHLRIFGTPITARIDEFVPESRLSWVPQGLDEGKPSHYHTWRFIPEPNGCRVETEETGVGPNDLKTPESSSRFMHRAHDLWLASLRWAVEQ